MVFPFPSWRWSDGEACLVDGDGAGWSLGARWDMTPWNALKVEYGFANYDGLDDEHLLSRNLSFAF